MKRFERIVQLLDEELAKADELERIASEQYAKLSILRTQLPERSFEFDYDGSHYSWTGCVVLTMNRCDLDPEHEITIIEHLLEEVE